MKTQKQLSKTAKYRMRTDGLFFFLEERKQWWLFTWWAQVFVSPFPEVIRERAQEMMKKDYSSKSKNKKL